MVRNEICINMIRVRLREGRDMFPTIMLEELFNVTYKYHSVCYSQMIS